MNLYQKYLKTRKINQPIVNDPTKSAQERLAAQQLIDRAYQLYIDLELCGDCGL